MWMAVTACYDRKGVRDSLKQCKIAEYNKKYQYEPKYPKGNVNEPRIIQKRCKRLGKEPINSDNADSGFPQSFPSIQPSEFVVSNVSAGKNNHPYWPVILT